MFYAGYYCDFALLAKQLRGAGFTGQLVSDDGSNDPHYVSQAGASVANGTLLSCACQESDHRIRVHRFREGVQASGRIPAGHLLRGGLRRDERHHRA